MSALPTKADKLRGGWFVRIVPQADKDRSKPREWPLPSNDPDDTKPEERKRHLQRAYVVQPSNGNFWRDHVGAVIERLTANRRNTSLSAKRSFPVSDDPGSTSRFRRNPAQPRLAKRVYLGRSHL